MIRDLILRKLRIPFKSPFKHASAERSETSSLWVEAHSFDGSVGYGESCPREYVTGETLDSARAFFMRHKSELCAVIGDLGSLRAWMSLHDPDIDANPAAWCAIELAILDLLAKARGQSVEKSLLLPPITGRFVYSAVLGDADPSAFRASAERYRAHGFQDFKIKLSGDLERDRAKLALLKGFGQGVRVRVDANNLWDNAADAIAFLKALEYPLFAVEEPIGVGCYTELEYIAAAIGCRIVLDESFLRIGQLDALRQKAGTWIVNLRVSKLGGLLRSLDICDEMRTCAVGVIVGAQVGETSLLTRAGLVIARAAGERLIAQEGAFGTFLLEHDPFVPVLMFASEGVLDSANYPSLRQSGFGLAPVTVANLFADIE